MSNNTTNNKNKNKNKKNNNNNNNKTATTASKSVDTTTKIAISISRYNDSKKHNQYNPSVKRRLAMPNDDDMSDIYSNKPLKRLVGFCDEIFFDWEVPSFRLPEYISTSVLPVQYMVKKQWKMKYKT